MAAPKTESVPIIRQISDVTDEASGVNPATQVTEVESDATEPEDEDRDEFVVLYCYCGPSRKGDLKASLREVAAARKIRCATAFVTETAAILTLACDAA